MTTIRKLKDPNVLNVSHGKPREPSPLTIARRKEHERLRSLMRDLKTTDHVFEVALDPDEKPITVRARLLRAAKQEDKQIAIRKYGNGFAVGLMTPERQSNRGRPAREIS